MKIAPISLSLAFLAAPLARATDHHVSPPTGIQAAIDVSVNGDRILAGPGTYFERIDFLGKAIEIIGVQGAASTILDGGSAGTVVTFANSEGPSSILRGFTVTHGSPGGVRAGDATPRIEDCVIASNHGDYGGGVQGRPTLVRCTIRNNTSTLAHGGGLFVESAGSTVDHCTVSGNLLSGSSEVGGGLYGPVTVRNSIFRGDDGEQIAMASTVTYSDVEGGYPGAGNIDAAPLFWDQAADDFHLRAGSPCIDAGDPASPL